MFSVEKNGYQKKHKNIPGLFRFPSSLTGLRNLNIENLNLTLTFKGDSLLHILCTSGLGSCSCSHLTWQDEQDKAFNASRRGWSKKEAPYFLFDCSSTSRWSDLQEPDGVLDHSEEDFENAVAEMRKLQHARLVMCTPGLDLAFDYMYLYLLIHNSYAFIHNIMCTPGLPILLWRLIKIEISQRLVFSSLRKFYLTPDDDVKKTIIRSMFER